MKAEILSGLLLNVLSELTRTIGIAVLLGRSHGAPAKPWSASGERIMPLTFLAISSLRYET